MMAKQSSEDKLGQLEKDYLASRRSDFRGVLACCESPIEKLFVAGLMCWGFREVDALEYRHVLDTFRGLGMWSGYQLTCRGDVVAIQSRIRLGEGIYRPDVCIIGAESRTVVELDGHEFHERTKEQAQRDKARDRAFTFAGWRVLRFTGSEVFADATGCVSEVFLGGLFRDVG